MNINMEPALVWACRHKHWHTDQQLSVPHLSSSPLCWEMQECPAYHRHPKKAMNVERLVSATSNEEGKCCADVSLVCSLSSCSQRSTWLPGYLLFSNEKSHKGRMYKATRDQTLLL